MSGITNSLIDRQDTGQGVEAGGRAEYRREEAEEVANGKVITGHISME